MDNKPISQQYPTELSHNAWLPDEKGNSQFKNIVLLMDSKWIQTPTTKDSYSQQRSWIEYWKLINYYICNACEASLISSIYDSHHASML